MLGEWLCKDTRFDKHSKTITARFFLSAWLFPEELEQIAQNTCTRFYQFPTEATYRKEFQEKYFLKEFLRELVAANAHNFQVPTK